MRASALFLVAISCAGSDSGSGSLTIDYQLFKRGQNVSCADAPEVREVEFTLFTANGITPLAGWPRKASCNDSFTAEGVPAGGYILQVNAYGDLQGDPSAVLYQTRSDITVPSSALELSLEPQVAYLDLSWTFGTEMLGPCPQVDSIDVLVAAGSGDPFNGRFDCTETPLMIAQPFSLQSYAIEVIANSDEGFPLFTSRVQRTLDRGLNEYTAILQPLGGQVLIDFNFLAGGSPTRLCDDPRVGATNLTAVIDSLEGGETVRESFSCMEARPYAFQAARFTQGRLLQLSLIAEATERYKGVMQFTMPSGDFMTGLMTLVPVGSATVAVEVTSSTCAADPDSFDIAIRAAGDDRVVYEASVVPPADHAPIIDLPYGSYDVSVDERVSGQLKCTAMGARMIGDRENAWDPFVF